MAELSSSLEAQQSVQAIRPPTFNAGDTLMKVKDPVCGMMIEQGDAVATSDYEGKRYYFCSQDCKVEFDENPEDYAGEGGQQP